MKVKKLILSNYRGFSHLDLVFGDRITVLAGINGSGKSAILRSLAAVLSHLLPKIAPSKETPEPLSAEDVHIGKPALTISATFDDGDQMLHCQVTRSIPDRKKFREYLKRRNEARFAIRETRKGSKEEKDLLEEIRFLGVLLDQNTDHFSFQKELNSKSSGGRKRTKSNPIAILYSTSRYLGRLPPRIRPRPSEPASAYAGALSGNEVSLGAFASWVKVSSTGLFGGRVANKRLIALLSNVISTLLPGFTRLRLVETPLSARKKVRPLPRLYISKGETEFDLNQLSDGERGLLALAFDLTRRLAIANPNLKNPIAGSEAIVLLDEIELHLHPNWQRKVLARLVETFKKCQFIATTHSPQVLGECPLGSVWMLDTEGEQVIAWQPDRTFGMDSNQLLDELMSAESQNPGVKAKVNEISEMVDKDQFKKAEQSITALEPSLGTDHPELIRLRALISFVTGKK